MLANAQSRLYELAEERGGFFTAHEARLAGFEPAHIVTLAVRGQIEQRSRGVYRLPLYPRSHHEQLQEAALWPQAHHRLSYSLISHACAGVVRHLRRQSSECACYRAESRPYSAIRPALALTSLRGIASYGGRRARGSPRYFSRPIHPRRGGDRRRTRRSHSGFTGRLQRGLIRRREYESLNRRLGLYPPGVA
jgi:hypothetical protein